MEIVLLTLDLLHLKLELEWMKLQLVFAAVSPKIDRENFQTMVSEFYHLTANRAER